MPAFRVPIDPPLTLSSLAMIWDDLAYAPGAFKCFLAEETDFAA